MQLPDSSPIYLDYHATTPVDPRVAEGVQRFMTLEFGNASSSDHTWGDRPCLPKSSRYTDLYPPRTTIHCGIENP